MHLVVQRERMIALAPVVADARLAIDDERVDVERLQSRGDGEAGLAAADDENFGIAVGVGGGRQALVEPVGAAEIARVGFAGRAARAADVLLVALDLVERGEQVPGFEFAAVGGEADDAVAAGLRGLEGEDGFDGVDAGAGDLARRRALGVDAEVRGGELGGGCLQLGKDFRRAGDGADVPGQRQHVAPVAVGVEERGERGLISRAERAFEAGEPVAGNRCEALCRLGQHAHLGSVYG